MWCGTFLGDSSYKVLRSSTLFTVSQAGRHRDESASSQSAAALSQDRFSAMQ